MFSNNIEYVVEYFDDLKGVHIIYMEMLAIKLIIGVVIGIVCNYVCSQIEKYILNKRNLEMRTLKFENIIVMMLTMIAGVAIMMKFHMVTEIIFAFLMLIVCVLIAVIDLHHRIIPNKLLLVMLIIKLTVGVPQLLGAEGFPKFNVLYSLIGLVVGFVIFIIPAAFGKSVGAGDIKLSATIGFCLGVDGLLYSIVLMGCCVLAYSIIQRNVSFRNMIYEMIPMGPFIAFSTVIVMIIR